MLLDFVLVLNDRVINTKSELDRLVINEIGLVGDDLLEVVGVALHRHERVQAGRPELGGAVKFEDRQSTLDSGKIAEIGRGVVLDFMLMTVGKMRPKSTVFVVG